MLAGIATLTGGRLPRGSLAIESDADSAVALRAQRRSYPKPDGTLTFDKLSSVYASGNTTRDDAPDHIRIERQVPLELAEAWVNMCPAGVYELAAGVERRNGDGYPRRDCLELRAVRRDLRTRRPSHARGGGRRSRVRLDVTGILAEGFGEPC